MQFQDECHMGRIMETVGLLGARGDQEDKPVTNGFNDAGGPGDGAQVCCNNGIEGKWMK